VTIEISAKQRDVTTAESSDITTTDNKVAARTAAAAASLSTRSATCHEPEFRRFLRKPLTCFDYLSSSQFMVPYAEVDFFVEFLVVNGGR
jgi:hypothetical protein